MTNLYRQLQNLFLGKPTRFWFKVGPVSDSVTEWLTAPVLSPQYKGRQHGEVLIAMQITDSQQFPITIGGYTDKRGNPVPAPTGGTFGWSVDNPNLLTLTPSADGSSCNVAAVGPLGDAKVTLKINDANGNPLVAGTMDVTIITGAPASVTLTPGTVTEQ